MYPRNSASPERIAIGPVVQISDGVVQTSGCTVRVLEAGGTEGDGGGTTAYSTDGVVLYTPTQAETDQNSFVLIAKKTGCIPASVTVVTSASATAGYAGVDWSKVTAPTTTLALTGTTVATTQKVDVETIKTQAVTAAAGVTFPTSIASPTNITAGTITTVTNLTNLPAITSNWITAAGIAASALNGKGDWNIGKTGYALTATTGLGNQTANITGTLSGSVGSVTGAVGSVTGSVGSVTGAVGSVTGNVGGSVASVTGAVGSVTANVNAVLINGAHGGAAATMTLGGAGGLTATHTGNTTGSVGSVTGAVGSVTGAVGSVTGSVGSVTGLTAANLDAAVSSRMASYTQPTGFLAATFPGTVASPTNITAATGITLAAVTHTGAVIPTVSAVTGLTAADVGAIKTKTDSLTFTQAGHVDANVQRINDVTITGDGQSGTEFGV